MLSFKNSISTQENITADTWLNFQTNPTTRKVLSMITQIGDIETNWEISYNPV